MRISWVSNAPWTQTGYGTQTAQVTRRLVADGHHVAVTANYGLHGQLVDWEGIPVYPGGLDSLSVDVIGGHWWEWTQRDLADPGLLVTLYDVWPFETAVTNDPDSQLLRVPLIASWVPIDHMPAPTKVAEWCARPNVMPIAMARHGSTMLDRAGIDHLYVPHAIEDVFRPTFTMPSGAAARDVLEVDESSFLVMINAANNGTAPCRKGYPEMFMAFAMFAVEHPDSVLYVHSIDQPGPAGVDLRRLADVCGIPRDKVRFVDQYAYRMGLPAEFLAALYTAADVVLSTSLGEGFGIPVIEAQACGTPVIVSDWSAQSELVGAGWKVPTQPLWDEQQHAWWGVPKIDHITGALTAAADMPRGVSSKAKTFAERYAADAVFDRYWRPAMERLGNMAA